MSRWCSNQLSYAPVVFSASISAVESEFKSKSGLVRIWRATGYSIAGLKAAWAHEHAFRQELMLCVVGALLALALPLSWVERFVLIAVLWLVLIVELLNSAIEAVVDRSGLEFNEFSKRAKDIASAAVLMSLLLAAAVWLIVCFPLIQRQF
jgi:diacylglycerol kinase (ATP)